MHLKGCEYLSISICISTSVISIISISSLSLSHLYHFYHLYLYLSRYPDIKI